MAMWKRRMLGVALGVALLAALAGCAGPMLPWQAHGPTPLPDAQQILRVSIVGQSDSAMLDPIHGATFDLSGALPLSLVWSGLLAFDSGLRPVPALADRYSVSADGLRYTFHLRAGARFSDGAPITSADAAFSLDRAAGPCGDFFYFFTALKDEPRYAQEICQRNPHGPPTITAGAAEPLITTLVGDALLTPDPRTLVIVLSQPDGALPVKLAEPVASVVERAIVLRYGGAWLSHLSDHGGVGTSGAYSVTSSASNGGYGQTITLTRAKGYWGARPRLRQVIVDVHNTLSAQPGDVVFAGATRGGDSAFQANQRYIQQVMRKQPGFHQTPIRAEDWLLLDPTEPGLTDLRARQALALALDKPALATLLSGVATSYLIPSGAGDYSTALSGPIASAPLTGDPAQARA
ncbi:MAG: ABC transporter substrate-binding protein, partial [Chloroflexota bacterium]|nr:ABC transporter substrate-binding protein [Chloroflexota bacterium]